MMDKDKKDTLERLIERSITENKALQEVIEITLRGAKESWSTKSIEERVELLKDTLLGQHFIVESTDYRIHYRDVARIIKEFGAIRNRLAILEDEMELVRAFLLNRRDLLYKTAEISEK